MLVEALFDYRDELVPVLSKPDLSIAIRQPVTFHDWQDVLSEFGVEPLCKINKRIDRPADKWIIMIVA